MVKFHKRFSMQHSQAISSYESLKAHVYPLLKVLAGSLFIALSAQISIPLPFSPVPLTGQTLAVLLLGMTLGSKEALFSTLLYLAQSMMGLPVLAAGLSNPLILLSPTAGYLIAMPLQAYIAGLVNVNRSETYNFFILSSACLFVLLMGTCGLALFVGLSQALYLGFYPFLLGECLKVTLAMTYYSTRRLLSA